MSFSDRHRTRRATGSIRAGGIGQHLGQEGEVVLSGDSIEELEVATEEKQRIETTHLFDVSAPNHRGGDQDESVGSQEVDVLRLP